MWPRIGAVCIQNAKIDSGSPGRQAGPQLNDDGIAHLAAGLLFAGHAPVVAIIDRGMLLLLTHPEQREALRSEPALAAQAVEEIFRFASPIERMRAARRGGLTRCASVDVEIDGVTLRAGDTVSRGAHLCPGAHLARVELQYLFVRLLQRFPGLRLAVPLEEIQPLREAVAGAVSQLPVAW
ncbi:MAG: hypothetical protein M3Y48_14600 [Actinomycetota bacterium]|nr:hypothetical protein [Actinomycetota bacterium]